MASKKTSCDSRLTRILMAQYKAFTEDPHPNLLAWMDPEDIRVWYFLVVGLDAPYLGGEYIFKLTAPDEFPHKPPRFEFLTQNGIFQPGGPICISVGEFHAEDKPGKDGAHGWRPSLGMKGFATQVVNGMICFDALESGIRIVNLHVSLKTLYAKMSHEQNKKLYPEVFVAFESLLEAYPEAEPALNTRDGRLRLAGKPIPKRAAAAPETRQPAGSVEAAQAAPTVLTQPVSVGPAVPASVENRDDNLAGVDASDLLDELLGEVGETQPTQPVVEEVAAVVEVTVPPVEQIGPATEVVKSAVPTPPPAGVEAEKVVTEAPQPDPVSVPSPFVAPRDPEPAPQPQPQPRPQQPAPSNPEDDSEELLATASVLIGAVDGVAKDEEMDDLINSLLDTTEQ